MGEMGEKMAELEKKLKLKKRGKKLKRLVKKGANAVGSSCKKGWKTVRELADKIKNKPSSTHSDHH